MLLKIRPHLDPSLLAHQHNLSHLSSLRPGPHLSNTTTALPSSASGIRPATQVFACLASIGARSLTLPSPHIFSHCTSDHLWSPFPVFRCWDECNPAVLPVPSQLRFLLPCCSSFSQMRRGLSFARQVHPSSPACRSLTFPGLATAQRLALGTIPGFLFHYLSFSPSAPSKAPLSAQPPRPY